MATTRAPLERLSERELQVLDLLSRGCSNLAIGERLRVMPKTVEAHVRSVFAKLDLEPRADEHRRVLAAVTYLGHRSDTGPDPHGTDAHGTHSRSTDSPGTTEETA
ncbi:putative two-component system response regulator [Actinokineospora spheciospongiae]|uniref:Putative two-component system response regulator n=1 Tax=Actinokineospora spheciospongiae TaxID=909613 RepID=W7J058_9PSEU|nr:helix-turn-helix transcriptional regulator [Actinokineospora spheciospongiae]EWC62352.1 putative two-component system response regulator [Actinokineospora spheciospongiae]